MQWIRLNRGLLVAVLAFAFLIGIVAKAWRRKRQKPSSGARDLTPEEMGLLNVIRLSVNRLWAIRKRKVVKLKEWREERE